jgi:hypothetical protein
MSTQRFTAGLFGLVLAGACRHHPAPEPAARLARDPSCAASDSGTNLGQDVRRGPRYRVDSSGQVESLPPTPTAGSDSAKGGCPAAPDSSGRDTSEPAKP